MRHSLTQIEYRLLAENLFLACFRNLLDLLELRVPVPTLKNPTWHLIKNDVLELQLEFSPCNLNQLTHFLICEAIVAFTAEVSLKEFSVT
jgi:hypothetical protein